MGSSWCVHELFDRVVRWLLGETHHANHHRPIGARTPPRIAMCNRLVLTEIDRVSTKIDEHVIHVLLWSRASVFTLLHAFPVYLVLNGLGSCSEGYADSDANEG